MEFEHIKGTAETEGKPLDGGERHIAKELNELPEHFDTVDGLDKLPEEFGEEDGARSDFQKDSLNEGLANPVENQNHEIGYAPNWKNIETEHNRLEDLRDTNPNYEKGNEWRVNCQRCVPTYEMRRRGYDVTANPAPPEASKHLAYYPFDVWEKADVKRCKESGMSDIQEAMKKWGDGARAQIVVYWDKGCGGHTFVAEQTDGKTHFVDPQTGEEGVEWYFDHVSHDRTQFCRIDDKEAFTYILDCCKEREV